MTVGYVVDVLKMVDDMSFHVQDVELEADPEIVHVSRFVEFRGLKKASYARSPPLITHLLPLAHSNRPHSLHTENTTSGVLFCGSRRPSRRASRVGRPH